MEDIHMQAMRKVMHQDVLVQRLRSHHTVWGTHPLSCTTNAIIARENGSGAAGRGERHFSTSLIENLARIVMIHKLLAQALLYRDSHHPHTPFPQSIVTSNPVRFNPLVMYIPLFLQEE